MPHLTIADWLNVLIVDPIGRFLLAMVLFLLNFALVYLLCLTYLHRKGLPSLERPAFGDREAQGRVTWQILVMRTRPDMDVALRATLWLNRLLAGALVLCALGALGTLFTSH